MKKKSINRTFDAGMRSPCLKIAVSPVGVSLLLFFTVVIAPVYPQTTLPTTKELNLFSIDVWRTEQGLPQNSVRGLCQSSDGHIWFGTQEGLVRYDGRHFNVYTSRNVEALLGNDVYAISESSDKTLWIGTNPGGVALYRNKTFFRLEHPSIPQNWMINKIVHSPTGDTWIGAKTGLWRYKNGELTKHTTMDGLPNELIHDILVDAQGAVYVATDNGLARFENDRFEVFDSKPGLQTNVVTALAKDRDGILWVGTSRGLYRLHGMNFNVQQIKNEMDQSRINSLLVDSSGSLWVGSTGGVARIHKGSVSTLTPENGLPATSVSSLMLDHEGSLWIGSSPDGLLRLREAPVTVYTSRHGLTGEKIYSVRGTMDNGILMGSYVGKIYKLLNGRVSLLEFSNQIPKSVLRSVIEDRRGAIWAAIDDRIYRYYRNKLDVFGTDEGLSGGLLRMILEDRDGTIWVGSDGGGLSIYQNGRFINYFIKSDSLHSVVRTLHEDRQGAMWVGAYGALTRIEGDERRTYTSADGIPSTLVRTLYTDADDVLWIGTYGSGLIRFHNGRFTHYTTRVGLFNDVIFSIQEDDHDNLWMSCNLGIFKISKKELHEFADGKIAEIHSIVYGRADGMRSSECNGGDAAGWRGPDGTFYWPTLGGLASVNPNKMPRNSVVPPVMIDFVTDDHRRYEGADQITIPQGYRSLHIRYSALTYIAPDRVKFKYRLNGYENDWQHVGARPDAYYTNIPPGQYKFEVQAANADGIWNTVGASVLLELEPYYYQTTWFYILCCGLVVLLGYSVFRNRVRAFEEHQRTLKKLVKERTKELEVKIEEQFRTEQALRESERQYREFFEQDLTADMTCTLDGSFLTCNPAFTTIFGFDTIEEARQGALLDLFSEQAQYDEFMNELRSKDAIVYHELDLVRKDKKRVHIVTNMTVISDRDGKPTGIRGYFFDNTKLKKLEQNLRQAQKLEGIGALTAGIAHNFNNILAIILAHTNRIEDGFPQNHFASDSFRAVSTAIDRGATLVRQMLTFSRKEGSNTFEMVNVNHIVQELSNILRETFPKTISVHLELTDQQMKIRADANSIHQALLNVCLNARDAMRSGGTLTVRTSTFDGVDLRNRFPDANDCTHICVAVSDTGMGMDDATRQRIFEPFFTTKEAGAGTGLGLPSVYGTMSNHKGFIDVKSVLREGTTFSLYFPEALEEKEAIGLGEENVYVEER